MKKHSALLQLVRAAIMALTSENISHMDELQALEKVSCICMEEEVSNGSSFKILMCSLLSIAVMTNNVSRSRKSTKNWKNIVK